MGFQVLILLLKSHASYRFGVDEPGEVCGRVALPGGAHGADRLPDAVRLLHARDPGLLVG